MAHKVRQRSKKRISGFTKFGVVILCLVICGTLIYKSHILKEQYNEYSKQITQLKKEKKEAFDKAKELEDYEEYVKTDEFVEEVARDNLGLVYKDEVIFEPDSYPAKSRQKKIFYPATLDLTKYAKIVFYTVQS